MITDGGRALNGLGVLTDYQTQSNSECRQVQPGSQSLGAKVQGRKGNNPDRQLRSLSVAKWERMWEDPDNQEVGLEAAIL